MEGEEKYISKNIFKRDEESNKKEKGRVKVGEGEGQFFQGEKSESTILRKKRREKKCILTR